MMVGSIILPIALFIFAFTVSQCLKADVSCSRNTLAGWIRACQFHGSMCSGSTFWLLAYLHLRGCQLLHRTF